MRPWFASVHTFGVNTRRENGSSLAADWDMKEHLMK